MLCITNLSQFGESKRRMKRFGEKSKILKVGANGSTALEFASEIVRFEHLDKSRRAFEELKGKESGL